MQPDALIAAAADSLKKMGITARFVPRRRQGGPAGRFVVAAAKGEAEFLADVRPSLTLDAVGAEIARLQRTSDDAGPPHLIVTGLVTPPMAERLRASKQPFLDAAGNVYLEGPGLYVFVVGRRPDSAPRRLRRDRAYTASGLRVVFALLCDPDLADRPQRAIAEAADVALGAVPAILADLQRRGDLAVAGRRRRFLSSKRVLDDWAAAYARTLRPTTLTRRFRVDDVGVWKTWTVDPTRWTWGGEPAAHLLDGWIEPGVLTISTRHVLPELIVAKKLKAADLDDASANVEIRRPFWVGALGPKMLLPVTPAVLVYADLLAVGDGRCIEAAKRIYDRYLAGSLEQPRV